METINNDDDIVCGNCNVPMDTQRRPSGIDAAIEIIKKKDKK